MDVAYLATVGFNERPPFNSMRAVLLKYRPNIGKILLLCSRDDDRRRIRGTRRIAERIKRMISKLQYFSGIKIEILEVSQESIEDVYKRIMNVAEKAKEEGLELWIDITGGRKTMSSGALLAAKDLGVRCFYFWLYDPIKNKDRDLEEMLESIDYEVVEVGV